MKIWALFFILSSLLLGCSSFGKSNRVKIAERATTELIGTSKQELITCAGPPTRSITIDEMEFIVYVGDDACEVTFVLKNGTVEKVSYASHKRGMPPEMELCATILEKCLSNR